MVNSAQQRRRGFSELQALVRAQVVPNTWWVSGLCACKHLSCTAIASFFSREWNLKKKLQPLKKKAKETLHHLSMDISRTDLMDSSGKFIFQNLIQFRFNLNCFLYLPSQTKMVQWDDSVKFDTTRLVQYQDLFLEK
jgi:hypothetical protein